MIIITATARDQVLQTNDATILKQSSREATLTVLYPSKNDMKYHAHKIVGVVDEVGKTFFDVAGSSLGEVKQVAEGYLATITLVVAQRHRYTQATYFPTSAGTTMGVHVYRCRFIYFFGNGNASTGMRLNVNNIQRDLGTRGNGNMFGRIEKVGAGTTADPYGWQTVLYPSGNQLLKTTASNPKPMDIEVTGWPNDGAYATTVDAGYCLLIV